MPGAADLPFWRPPTPGMKRALPPPTPPPEPVFVPNLAVPMMGAPAAGRGASPAPSHSSSIASSNRGPAVATAKFPSRSVQGDYDVAEYAQHRWELSENPSSATLVNSRATAASAVPAKHGGVLSSIGGIANNIFNASAELMQKQLIDSSDDDSDGESCAPDSMSRGPLPRAHGRGSAYGVTPTPATQDVPGPSPPLTFSQTFSDIEPRGTSPHAFAAVGADAVRHRYVENV